MLKLISTIALSLVINTTAHALNAEDAKACSPADYSSLEQNPKFIEGMQVFASIASTNPQEVNQIIARTVLKLSEQSVSCKEFEDKQLSYFSNLAFVSFDANANVQNKSLAPNDAFNTIVLALFSVVGPS